MNKQFTIKPMTIEDYDGLHALWMTIHGFGIRSIDDSRRGCLYHVCVREDYRRLGIGKAMVVHCMNALKAEHINKVSLIAFTQNDIGNAFWKCIGWTKREDLNYYDFTLNEENITAFNK